MLFHDLRGLRVSLRTPRVFSSESNTVYVVFVDHFKRRKKTKTAGRSDCRSPYCWS